MNEEKVMEIFRKTKAYQEGHFLFTSGRHSNNYMQCAKVLQYPEHTIEFGREIARFFTNQKIESVVSPAMGGIIIGYEVARQLEVRSLFAERENGKMNLRRSQEIKKGEKILVVEDVITTGGSVFEVIDLVKENGGIPVGIGVIVDRTGGEIDFGIPLKPVLSKKLGSWEAEECPLCKEGKIPIQKPGSKNLLK